MLHKKTTVSLLAVVLLTVLCCAGCAKEKDSTTATTEQTVDQTKDANLKMFEKNTKKVMSAIAMYQAAHGGDYPKSTADVEHYMMDGDLDSIQDKPLGATYVISGTSNSDFKFTATYTDVDGETYIYSYPSE